MTGNVGYIIFIIGLALIFDFLNGFHDAANSIATIVSTRVLKPRMAVLWAAFFNLAAFFIFDVQVANTIGQGLISPGVIDPNVIFAALTAGIVWNIATWYYGIPSSSSHALIGGLLGASIAKSSLSHVNFIGVSKILISIVASPVLGLILSIIFMTVIGIIFKNVSKKISQHFFQKMQLVSSAMVSLGHGGNDAQKTMGVIAVLLYSSGLMGPHFHVPLWVVLSCYFVIALGTLFGGWRIIKTMGTSITKLTPLNGTAAETAAACSLFLATHLGIPVSTTHTITGAIVGVGISQKRAVVHWGVAKKIVWAWIITIPATLLFAALIWYILQHIPIYL